MTHAAPAWEVIAAPLVMIVAGVLIVFFARALQGAALRLVRPDQSPIDALYAGWLTSGWYRAGISLFGVSLTIFGVALLTLAFMR